MSIQGQVQSLSFVHGTYTYAGLGKIDKHFKPVGDRFASFAQLIKDCCANLKGARVLFNDLKRFERRQLDAVIELPGGVSLGVR